MPDYDFLKSYVEKLPIKVKNRRTYKFGLKPRKSTQQINYFAQMSGIRIPGELKLFYEFSYGASLGEYRILTIAEINRLTSELCSTYREEWQDYVFPFAISDTGDVIAFHLKRSRGGRLLILDGFHEYSPLRWKGICFGLHTWLQQMARNRFRPYWLESTQNN